MTTFSCLWCSAISCEKGNYHAMHAKGDKKLKWNLFGRVAFLQRKTLRRVAAHTTISYKVKVKKKVPTFWNTYSAGGTNYRKCESCCVSPVQHFPLKQILISANLSKIVRPAARELLKNNSPLANLVTIALTVTLVIASCFSPKIFQDHIYTYIHAVYVT